MFAQKADTRHALSDQMGRQNTHRLHTVHTHDIAHRPLFDTAVMVELKNAVPQIYQFLHIFRRQHFNAEDRIDIFIQAERQNAVLLLPLRHDRNARLTVIEARLLGDAAHDTVPINSGIPRTQNHNIVMLLLRCPNFFHIYIFAQIAISFRHPKNSLPRHRSYLRIIL